MKTSADIGHRLRSRRPWRRARRSRRRSGRPRGPAAPPPAAPASPPAKRGQHAHADLFDDVPDALDVGCGSAMTGQRPRRRYGSACSDSARDRPPRSSVAIGIERRHGGIVAAGRCRASQPRRVMILANPPASAARSKAPTCGAVVLLLSRRASAPLTRRLRRAMQNIAALPSAPKPSGRDRPRSFCCHLRWRATYPSGAERLGR